MNTLEKFIGIVVVALIGIGPAGLGLASDASPGASVHAELQTITEWYEAVGTVRPHAESRVEAQVTAQVVDVKVRPGNKVTKGMLIVTLDNRQFLSRLDQAKEGLKSAIASNNQAKQGVVAAEAAFDQAESNYNRVKTYFESKAATAQSLERAKSQYLQARAGLEKAREALAGSESNIRQAEEMVKEAEIAMEYTKIRAPEAGEVLRRMVEPGDLAHPGKPLLVLQTAHTLLLEANVREGLIQRIELNITLPVLIGSIDQKIDAVIREIIPYADPKTRTFLVKASLPRIKGVYPGMFGKLLIPVIDRKVVLIPPEAVRNVGQLELVSVKSPDGWRSRYIKTGKRHGDMIEVLSGLSGNETIGLKGE